MSVYQNSKVFPARICLSTYFRFFPILSRKTAIAEGKIGYCLNEIHCRITKLNGKVKFDNNLCISVKIDGMYRARPKSHSQVA